MTMRTIRIAKDTAELLKTEALPADILPVGDEYEFQVDEEVYATLCQISTNMDQAVRSLYADV
jgi:hypothetical protein